MTQTRLPPTQIALLLILMEIRQAHAWQIKKILEKRGFEFWVDIKTSTIYKSLGIIEEKALALGIKEEDGTKTPKKVYSITEKGEDVLKEQLVLCISDPPISKSVFDLGITGLCFLSKNKAISSLETYLQGVSANIQWFESILNQFNQLDSLVKDNPEHILAGSTVKELQKNPLRHIIRALFERPYYIIRAQKEWVSKFLLEITDDTEGKFIFSKE